MNLFATAASCSERDTVANLNAYVTGETFRFYLTHIFQNNKSRKWIKKEMITRSKVYDGDFSVTHELEAFQHAHHSNEKY